MVTHSNSKQKVLITGATGFTGFHLSQLLKDSGYSVFGTTVKSDKSNHLYRCDIRNKGEIKRVLEMVQPEYIVHLGAISFVESKDKTVFYSVNCIGSENLLQACIELNLNLKKIVLASSATVYGNQNQEVLYEFMSPKPINHYGVSKFAMEQIVSNYFGKLPIIVTRPFNYTGVGQSLKFLIPKIVYHYKNRLPSIELGNLNVSREFNDIRFVVEVYKRLLQTKIDGEVVNIASNRPIKLLKIIDIMNELAGYKIDVRVNPKFVRENEIISLSGSTEKLKTIIEIPRNYTIQETLRSMFEA